MDTKVLKAAAKKARKQAGRAHRKGTVEESQRVDDYQATGIAPTSKAAPLSVSVDILQINGSVRQATRAGEGITAFDSIIGRSDRWGIPLSASLVQSCVLGCVKKDMLAVARPTPIQSEVLSSSNHSP